MSENPRRSEEAQELVAVSHTSELPAGVMPRMAIIGQAGTVHSLHVDGPLQAAYDLAILAAATLKIMLEKRPQG